ncbi:MAG: excinuclease ABC subunit A, partial [Ligilactobacillus agilis]|nr:excinuclease ABC subunit A [Ligilactobacillus agilis]
KLNQLGIYSIADLAHFDPHVLRNEFGISGFHLYALAWGIDRSDLTKRLTPKNPSWSSSQVMPRDLSQATDIETGIAKVARDVTNRLNRHQQKTSCIRLGYTYAGNLVDANGKTSYSHEITIQPTSDYDELLQHLLTIFHQDWSGLAVRKISVGFSRLSDANISQISLF